MTQRRQNAEKWAPVLLIYLGMFSFLFCLIFWAITTRLEPILLGAGGTLMGLSQGLDAYQKTLRGPPESPPVKDPTVGESDS